MVTRGNNDEETRFKKIGLSKIQLTVPKKYHHQEPSAVGILFVQNQGIYHNPTVCRPAAVRSVDPATYRLEVHCEPWRASPYHAVSDRTADRGRSHNKHPRPNHRTIGIVAPFSMQYMAL